MFSHVSILLSFVFAIAITHLLTSATELVWARDRVRPSWIQVLWMFNALLGLLVNWIGMWYLSARPHWDVAEVTINFAAALIQYFTCSLISIRVRDDGVVDMPAFYARQRPLIFSAFAAMVLINMFQNWWDRNILPEPNSWIYADLTLIPMLAVIAVGGWARAVWQQWLAAILMTGMVGYFLAGFALGVRT
jgi:hypothetical protein